MMILETWFRYKVSIRLTTFKNFYTLWLFYCY